MAWWLECSPMARKTRVQSLIESYQRLKKWYLMLPCLILSIIRYGSRVKWSNPEKGVAPSPTPQCRSYRKGSLQVTLNYSLQLYLLIPKIRAPNCTLCRMVRTLPNISVLTLNCIRWSCSSSEILLSAGLPLLPGLLWLDGSTC